MYQYKNLWIGLGVIALITYSVSHIYYDFARGSMMDMQVLMGVWFLVFGCMKLVDISGFATMFAQYDPLAQRVYIYGLLYPFIEIIIGGLYIRDMQMQYRFSTNIIVAIMTGLMSVGIIYILAIQTTQSKPICCACMGTQATVPLGRPSLIEQLSMCLMALYMLWMMMNMGMMSM